jgi:cytochrome P450
MSDLRDANFFTSKTLIDDPYPYYEALRAEGPIVPEEHQGVFMVTGYDECAAIYNDTETFSSATAVTGPFPGFPVPLEGDDVTDIIEQHRDELPFSDQLPTFDPPKHKDHRHLLMRLLTPKRLKENEEFMWRLADRQLDTFLESGTCEYIRQYAGPYALLVIADLLGVPEEDHAEFKKQMGQTGGLGDTSGGSMTHSPLQFLYDTFTEYIEDRRKTPRSDVLTSIANTTFPDGTLPDPIHTVRVAANLFAAGQETTVRSLGASFQLLGEDQEMQAWLRADFDRIPNFVEEILRVESPVKGDFRLARRKTVVGGVEIPAGTTVMLLNSAANRDPKRFDEPARFIPDRQNAREHMTFGRGIHSCPGGSLARAETRVSIQRFLERTSNIRISEEHHGPASDRRYRYVPTFILRGLTELHLEFDPA